MEVFEQLLPDTHGGMFSQIRISTNLWGSRDGVMQKLYLAIGQIHTCLRGTLLSPIRYSWTPLEPCLLTKLVG